METFKKTHRHVVLVLVLFVCFIISSHLPCENGDPALFASASPFDEAVAEGKLIEFDQVVAFGSWKAAIEAFDAMAGGDRLIVKDTHYEGTGNAKGHLVEAGKDLQTGKLTIEVWPLSGNPGGHVELLRVCLYALAPGDELLFHEGLYQRLVSIYAENIGFHAGGKADKPIRIRGYGNGEKRPLFRNTAARNNLWEMMQSNVEISYMEFSAPIHRSLRLMGASKGKTDKHGTTLSMGKVQNIGDTPINRIMENLTVRDCIFRDTNGGVTIGSNDSGVEYNNLVIDGNTFENISYTVFYFGQHDGLSPHDGLVLRNNFVDCTDIPGKNNDIVGYCIETKRGVVGYVMENNLIISPYGPGIMFYGGQPGYPWPGTTNSVIRNNVIVGGRGDGINISGGPVTVENNIVMNNRTNIHLHSYGKYEHDNVYRGIAVRNNFTGFGRSGNVQVATAVQQSVSAGDVVVSGNTQLTESGTGLKAIATDMVQIRAIPKGFHALMAAISERYQSNKSVYTDTEVENLFVSKLEISVAVKENNK